MTDEESKSLSSRSAVYANSTRKSLIETLGNLFDALRSLAGFLILLGLLVTGAGIICFIPFRNPLSVLMLDLGFVMVLGGFAVKILDILIKIIGDRK